MTEMVERVARAMCFVECQCNKVRCERPEQCCEWPAFIEEARAAIAAMRDATEEMEKAGFAKTRVIMGDFCHATDCPLGAITPGGMFRRVWRAMIDAALAGAPTARPSLSTGSTEL